MQDVQTSNQHRQEIAIEPDTLFGVCQAIGEDLGFDPFYLRASFIGLLFFNPVAPFVAYVALAAVVAAAHLLFPTRAAAAGISNDTAEAPLLAVDRTREDREPSHSERELIAA